MKTSQACPCCKKSLTVSTMDGLVNCLDCNAWWQYVYFSSEKQIDPLPIGAHLQTPRVGYTHHGIYIGNFRVIHSSGLSQALSAGPVEETSLENFLDGRYCHVIDHSNPMFVGTQVVERARSKLGENRYNILFNNCEHFCEWCINNTQISEQVTRAAVATTSLAASAILPLGPWRILFASSGLNVFRDAIKKVRAPRQGYKCE